MCALFWKIITWCHHQIILTARYIPGCLNVMASLLCRSNQVQSTEWSLHRQVIKQIYQVVHSSCRPICHLSEPQSSIISLVPDRHIWDIDAVNINLCGSHCLCLSSHVSPSQGDQKKKSCYCNSSRPGQGCPGYGT